MTYAVACLGSAVSIGTFANAHRGAAPSLSHARAGPASEFASRRVHLVITVARRALCRAGVQCIGSGATCGLRMEQGARVEFPGCHEAWDGVCVLVLGGVFGRERRAQPHQSVHAVLPVT